jgi:hypothetical protein
MQTDGLDSPSLLLGTTFCNGFHLLETPLATTIIATSTHGQGVFDHSEEWKSHRQQPPMRSLAAGNTKRVQHTKVETQKHERLADLPVGDHGWELAAVEAGAPTLPAGTLGSNA